MPEPLQLLHFRPEPRPGHRFALIGGMLVLVVAVGAGWGYGWMRSYDGRIAPHVRIGSVAVGGLSPASAKLVLHQKADELFDRGAPVTLNGGRPATLTLAALAGGDFIEDAHVDIDDAVDQAARIGHGPSFVENAFDLASSLVRDRDLPIPVTLREDAIRASLANLYPDAEKPTQNAKLVFRQTNGAWTAKATDGVAGASFDVPRLLSDLQDRLSTLSNQPVDVRLNATEPIADKRVAGLAIEPALAALRAAPFHVYFGGAKDGQSFDVTDRLLAKSLGPDQDGSLLLDPEPIRAALKPFAESIEVKPTDARFSVADGRVTQFSPSADGLAVDLDATLQALREAVIQPDDAHKTIALATTVVHPDVPTEKANDLGIVSLLGTGVSDYSKSPSNRIKNIANGVKLLNGRLIAPDEVFSSVAALGPFTADNGYFPELVIKGDKIQAEIGGGLCQIGTTTFRAAMNSGLPIKERSNHSLVVSHYNDASNGNPGTDATIYDPAPDFKFANDTGKYLLLEAVMDPKSQELRFSFWGTTDGRKGSYNPPKVLRWIPPGDPIETPSPDLKPGEKKCQAAFPGADTTFDYTIVKPDGTSVVRTFTSHYRSLPKICLVGEDPSKAQTPATTVPVDATAIPD